MSQSTQRISHVLHQAYLGKLLAKHSRGETLQYEDLAESWDRVIAQHESFRSSIKSRIVEKQSNPAQVSVGDNADLNEEIAKMGQLHQGQLKAYESAAKSWYHQILASFSLPDPQLPDEKKEQYSLRCQNIADKTLINEDSLLKDGKVWKVSSQVIEEIFWVPLKRKSHKRYADEFAKRLEVLKRAAAVASSKATNLTEESTGKNNPKSAISNNAVVKEMPTSIVDVGNSTGKKIEGEKTKELIQNVKSTPLSNSRNSGNSINVTQRKSAPTDGSNQADSKLKHTNTSAQNAKSVGKNSSLDLAQETTSMETMEEAAQKDVTNKIRSEITESTKNQACGQAMTKKHNGDSADGERKREEEEIYIEEEGKDEDEEQEGGDEEESAKVQEESLKQTLLKFAKKQSKTSELPPTTPGKRRVPSQQQNINKRKTRATAAAGRLKKNPRTNNNNISSGGGSSVGTTRGHGRRGRGRRGRGGSVPK